MGHLHGGATTFAKPHCRHFSHSLLPAFHVIQRLVCVCVFSFECFFFLGGGGEFQIFIGKRAVLL